jgi:hypothetical protein
MSVPGGSESSGGPAEVISTSRLDLLPEPGRLFELCRSLALLEWILCPSVQHEYLEPSSVGEVIMEPEGAFCSTFAVNPDTRAALYTLNNGFGDEMHVWFGPPGTVVWGFDHESDANRWRLDIKQGKAPAELQLDLWAGLPIELWTAFDASGYSTEYQTFCIWRAAGEDRWRMGSVAFPGGHRTGGHDGSAWLLQGFNGPATYRDQVQQLYFVNEDETEGVWGLGRTIALPAVERIYAGEPLTRKLVRELFDAADPDRAVAAALAIGYPVVGEQPEGGNGSEPRDESS